MKLFTLLHTKPLLKVDILIFTKTEFFENSQYQCERTKTDKNQHVPKPQKRVFLPPFCEQCERTKTGMEQCEWVTAIHYNG